MTHEDAQIGGVGVRTGAGWQACRCPPGQWPGHVVREAGFMPGGIMTEVSAIVPGERADDIPAAFAELAQRPLPDGLLRTELLRTELLAGRDGEWKIQSLWRD